MPAPGGKRRCRSPVARRLATRSASGYVAALRGRRRPGGRSRRRRTMTRNRTPSAAQPRRFFLITMGCQMNRHDSARMAESLRGEGLEPAGRLADADVCIVNTCCVRDKAENKARSAVGRLAAWKRRRPGRAVVVAGCVAERLGPDWLQPFPTSMPSSAPTDSRRSPRRPRTPRRAARTPASPRARPPTSSRTPTAPRPAPPPSSPSPGLLAALHLLHRPRRPGAAALPSAADVEAEIDALVAAGARGHPPGAGGQRLRARRRRLRGLLRRAGAVPGLRRLRYTSPHPRFVDPETVRAHAELPTLCEHVHLPVQSDPTPSCAAWDGRRPGTGSCAPRGPSCRATRHDLRRT